MSITYTWTVTTMKVTRVGSETNYVVQVFWTKAGIDENSNMGSYQGSTSFEPIPDQTNFVPYDQLTQDIVLSWIQNSLTDKDEIFVNEQIAEQIAAKSGPVTDAQLPWAPSNPSTP